ncbi:MAG: hypothetical protein WCK94_12105 [Comamonadaceae bacterium]|jgi:hypothetical protein
MFEVHKPEWLYEALPYVYGVAGIVTIANQGNLLSMASGGLLVSAGVSTWWLRRSYRLEHKRDEVEHRLAQRKAAEHAESVRRESERLRNEV